MAVKIIATMKVAKGREKDLLRLFMELRTKAMSQTGYISGETLKWISDQEEFLVISTWKSFEDWKAWEDKPKRREIHAQIDAILEKKTLIKAYEYAELEPDYVSIADAF